MAGRNRVPESWHPERPTPRRGVVYRVDRSRKSGLIMPNDADRAMVYFTAELCPRDFDAIDANDPVTYLAEIGPLETDRAVWVDFTRRTGSRQED